MITVNKIVHINLYIDMLIEDGGCILDCDGVANGQYRSCSGCTEYIICDNGIAHHMQCPEGMIWDDRSLHLEGGWGQCKLYSRTCGGMLTYCSLTCKFH